MERQTEVFKKLNQAINHQKEIRIYQDERGYHSTTELEKVDGGITFCAYELNACLNCYFMISMCGENPSIQFDGKKLIVYTD